MSGVDGKCVSAPRAGAPLARVPATPALQDKIPISPNLRFLPAALLALGLSACSTGGGYDSRSADSSQEKCDDCGVVQRIESYFGERRTTGADAVPGALIGGIAGNEIEKNKNQTWYDITMRMNDGRAVVVSQNSLNGIREGYRVVIRQGNSCRVGRQPEAGDVVKKEFDRLPPPTMRVESDT